jgi:Outer membrane protein beta-barrel domain
MHENNFEKQVQEKMDQLGFDPSDAVWAAVDKEINKGKRRRRPFFILFFFSGLLIAGGGIYFGMIKNPSTNIIAGQQHKGKKENQDEQSEGKVQSSRQQEIAMNGKQSGETPFINSVNNNKWPANTVDYNGNKSNNSEKNIIVIKSGSDNIEGKNLAITKAEPQKSGNSELDSSAKKPMAAAENKMAIDSSPALKTASVEKKKVKTSLWKIGFTGGAGISNTNQSLFKQSNTTGLYYIPANVNVGTGAAAPVPVSSEINPGFSFSLGIFVSRNLSKRISISTGLNYHYYSTHVYTGYAVDSPIIVYNPVYYPGSSTLSGASYTINSYYRNGSNYSYTNSYHFIELPLTADFQLNKSLKLPVYWEAGLSVSYLLNSNALHFDPNGNLYYQNAELFNKIQLNGATAIMIGFPINKSEMQIGPQLQYGLTGLQKSGSGNPQHLFYTGLKISFIPRKK